MKPLKVIQSWKVINMIEDIQNQIKNNASYNELEALCNYYINFIKNETFDAYE